MSESRLYKGFAIRNGYVIVPLHLDNRFAYETLIRDEQAGTEEATEILDSLTLIAVLLEVGAEALGANLRFASARCIITPRQYPRAYKEGPYEHIRIMANAGNKLACRFVAWVTYKQMTDPNFQLLERER